ncbi:hypothetical protein VULLAG_LOCUS12072 [Vulpes lagopus]
MTGCPGVLTPASPAASPGSAHNLTDILQREIANLARKMQESGKRLPLTAQTLERGVSSMGRRPAERRSLRPQQQEGGATNQVPRLAGCTGKWTSWQICLLKRDPACDYVTRARCPAWSVTSHMHTHHLCTGVIITRSEE